MNMFTERVHREGLGRLFDLGCYSYIVTGVGHLGTQVISTLFRDQNAYNEFVAGMPTINLMGRDILYSHLSTGFSYAMGILLINVGVSYLLSPQRDVRLKGVALLTSLIMLVMSIEYFFIAPIALMAIATVSFALTLFFGQPHKGVNT